jgi:hypothetical protein
MRHEEILRLRSHPKLIWLGFVTSVTFVIALLAGASFYYDWVLLLNAGFWVLIAGLAYLALRTDSCYLELTPDGLLERQMFIKLNRSWQVLDRFVAIEESEGDLVAYRYVDGFRGPLLSRLARSACGMDGRLMENYGMTAKELAGLLNQWRWRYGPKPAAKCEFVEDWV